MSEPTNLDRAMWAEAALTAFDEAVRPEGCGYGLRPKDDLYDPPEDVTKDLITDLCHFLNLDESAGCMEPEAIKELLDRAFNMFEMEKEEEQ